MKTKTAISQNGLPRNFINQFGEHVTGILSGLDRVRFRATLRPLFCPNGPEVYLNYCKVLIKNFKGFAQGISDRVKKLAYESFERAGRPSIYLPSSELNKEALDPRTGSQGADQGWTHRAFELCGTLPLIPGSTRSPKQESAFSDGVGPVHPSLPLL